MALLALAVLGAVGIAVVMVLPLLGGALAASLELDEARIGHIASLELAGIALGNLALLLARQRCPWRPTALASLLACAALNVASAQAGSFQALAGLRFAAGLPAGVLVAIVATALGQRAQPEQAFASFTVAQVLLGTALMWLLPDLIAAFGVAGVYLPLAALALASLPLLAWLPQDRVAKSAGTARGALGRMPRPGLWCAVAVFLFFVGQGAFWTFAERVGTRAALSEDTIRLALTLATGIGLGGAVMAALLGTRCGRIAPILLGSLMQVIAVLPLAGGVSAFNYLLAVPAFNFFWSFIAPLQMGLASHVDASGRSVILANLLTGAGLAAGPALAAGFLDAFGLMSVLVLLAAGSLTSAAVLAWAGLAADPHE